MTFKISGFLVCLTQLPWQQLFVSVCGKVPVLRCPWWRAIPFSLINATLNLMFTSGSNELLWETGRVLQQRGDRMPMCLWEEAVCRNVCNHSDITAVSFLSVTQMVSQSLCCSVTWPKRQMDVLCHEWVINKTEIKTCPLLISCIAFKKITCTRNIYRTELQGNHENVPTCLILHAGCDSVPGMIEKGE